MCTVTTPCCPKISHPPMSSFQPPDEGGHGGHSSSVIQPAWFHACVSAQTCARIDIVIHSYLLLLLLLTVAPFVFYSSLTA